MSGDRKVVLEKFIDFFQKLSGLRVCIHDMSFFTKEADKLHLSIRLRRHNCPLCKYIKSSTTAHRECINRENDNLKKAFEKQKPIPVFCHAGLRDYLFPLIFHGRPIGGVTVGQVFTMQGYEKKLLHLARKYKLNSERLIKLAKNTPFLNEERLKQNAEAAGNLIVDYILTNEENVWLKRKLKYSSKKIEVDEQMLYSGEELDIPLQFLDLFRNFKEKDTLIKKMLEIVCQRYRERLNHNAIAKEMNLSPSTLTRKCKSELGMTFRECVLRTKLYAASHFLKHSNFTISQIAYYLGYSDASSFLHAFKSHFGITPKEYIHRSI